MSYSLCLNIYKNNNVYRHTPPPPRKEKRKNPGRPGDLNYPHPVDRKQSFFLVLHCFNAHSILIRNTSSLRTEFV